MLTGSSSSPSYFRSLVDMAGLAPILRFVLQKAPNVTDFIDPSKRQNVTLCLQDTETGAKVRAPAPQRGHGVARAKMNVKIKEKIGELLQSEENIRQLSEAMGQQLPTVTLKDKKGQDVKVQLQRKPVSFSSR